MKKIWSQLTKDKMMKATNWNKTTYQSMDYTKSKLRNVSITTPTYYWSGIALSIKDLDSDHSVDLIMDIEDAEKLINKLQKQIAYYKCYPG